MFSPNLKKIGKSYYSKIQKCSKMLKKYYQLIEAITSTFKNLLLQKINVKEANSYGSTFFIS